MSSGGSTSALARSYRVAGTTLHRIMPNGTAREVPEPGRRREVVEQTQSKLGHFGVRRTLGLLQTSFWWPGMTRDVSNVVGLCKLCDQVNATSNVRPEELQPLPIRGPYRTRLPMRLAVRSWGECCQGSQPQQR